MPHAFFGTFFRVERKYYPPSGRQPHPLAPESARQAPTKGEFLAAELPLFMQAGWLSARPPAPPSGSRRTNAGVCACGRTKGLSSGQTIGAVRTAVRSACCLPELPLVVCLNSGSLTAFGGCIHWIPASLRSPLETFGSPTEAIERPIGLQALLPRRSRRTPARGSAPAHSRISFLRSQNSAPERKGNAHALFCRW